MGDVHVVTDGEGWALDVDGQKRNTISTQTKPTTEAGSLARRGKELT